MTCRHVVATLLAFASWLAAETAVAQTVTAPVPTRGGSHTIALDKINHADCVANETINFGVTITTAGVAYQLAVWVGAGIDCNDMNNRMEPTPACHRVFYEPAEVGTMTVPIKVRDIIARDALQDGVETPETVCNPQDYDRTPLGITLYFLLVNNAGAPPDGFTGPAWPAELDVRGPSRPTSVTAGIGERALVVSWNEPEGGDVIGGYQLCWEELGTPAAGGNGGMAGGGMAGGGMAGDGMAGGGMAGGGVAGADMAGAGMTGSGTAGTGTTDGGVPACTSANLVPGQPPGSTVRCKTVSGSSSTSGEAKPLTNGVRYVVAVAAMDDFENPGDLSSIHCGTPEPVTGFFEAYRAAGGGAGGGYCAIGAVPSRAAAAGIVFAALGLLLRRRRRAARTNARGAA